MQSSLHTKEITTAQVASVSFGFFTDEEIRKISVKKLISPIIFDNLKNPVKGGLYDPALGPLDNKDRCTTCGLTAFECPGHFGHIELAVPLYNPLVFITLYKLLRCGCLHCFKFRMSGVEVERFRRRLELLGQGRLVDAADLLVGTSAAAKRAGDDIVDGIMPMLSDDDEEEEEEEEDSTPPGSSKHKKNKKNISPPTPSKPPSAKLTSQTLEATIDAISDFFKKQPAAGKCQNCGCHNPTIKREGHTKLFLMPLHAKKQTANALLGTPILENFLARMTNASAEVDALEEELRQGVLNEEKAKAAKKDEDEDEKSSVSLSDDDDGDEKKKTAKGWVDPKKPRKQAVPIFQDDEEEDEDGGGGSFGGAPSNPKFLTPSEVEQICNEIWKINEPMLKLIYPVDVARRERRRHHASSSPTAFTAAAGAAKHAIKTLETSGHRSFFIQTVSVAPNRFRPVSHVGDQTYEHAQNTLLVKLINGNLDLLAAGGEASGATAAEFQTSLGKTLRLWLDLQNSLNALFDSSTAIETYGVPGIRQGLEKKEGLFRKNMMGKRVNFACRSVISPDVYLNGGEIGVPPYFASRLSFPERVTQWNVAKLREAVIAGPGRNPGAVAVEDEQGRIVMLRRDKKSREAVANTLTVAGGGAKGAAAAGGSGGTPMGTPQLSMSIGGGGGGGGGGGTPATTLGTSTAAGGGGGLGPPGSALTSPPLSGAGRSGGGRVGSAGGGGGSGGGGGGASSAAAARYGGGKVVYRTMEDGDFMLTNRQPTLHKPGMMGHRARVMRAERTIRFHYANCATFNADFDGDEINLHLPQDHAGRAEGYGIVHADEQFFVPTDGKPLRGLIQDHIVAGTLMCMKDTFLTKAEYSQLVYECIASDCSGAWDIWMDEPTIAKPKQLWTGKQVITAVLMHYTRDQLPLSIACGGKVPEDIFGKGSGEGTLRIWRGHLVSGVIDKNVFGKHGLLHVIHELYGAERVSTITAALSRLFTAFLQHNGFTCGIADVFLVARAEEERARLLKSADIRALDAAAQYTSLPRPMEKLEAINEDGTDDDDSDQENGPSHTQEDKMESIFTSMEHSVQVALSERFRTSSSDAGAGLDMKVSGAMHPLSSEVVKVCLPGGQRRPFRHNMMALMTVTGAKGSVVNFSQISCLLGQQELEGRRVPRMASGKTLPCFAPFDAGARSGGFVGDRFLTGLRPQEYYFHCMAGREGLVDTTVKTSRSGYLQRCLVKNLESLRVAYDGTVRDVCDGSIVQCLYGDDGIDPTQASCLRTLPFLFYNLPQFAVRIEASAALAGSGGGGGAIANTPVEIKEAERQALELVHERAKAVLKQAIHNNKNKYTEALENMPLINEQVNSSVLGATSDGFADALTDAVFGGYMLPPDADPSKHVSASFKAIERKLKAAAKLANKGTPSSASASSQLPTFSYLDAMDFLRVMQVKYSRSMAQPGEAVGVIAAQSVGEPSTQMTLNTFHMAGRGEANVTLGIPRLRELLMTAAASIKTPVATLPMRQGSGSAEAQQLAVGLKRIMLGEALKNMVVEENVVAKTPETAFGRGRAYTVILQFHPPAAYPAEFDIKFKSLETCVYDQYRPRLQAAVKAEIRRQSGSAKFDVITSVKLSGQGDEFGGIGGGIGEEDGKKKKKKSAKDDEDENEEENEEYVEGKLRFAGGRGEQATYGEGDAEDAAIEKAARRAAEKRAGDMVDDDDDDDEEVEVEEEEEEEDADDEKEKSPPPESKSKSAAKKDKKDKKSQKKSTAEPVTTTPVGTDTDESDHTIRVHLILPLDCPKLLIREIAERVVASTVLRGVQGVAKCYILDPPSAGAPPTIQTDGINIPAAWTHADIVDVDRLTVNSPAAMLAAYGVEAARATVVREVSSVFGAYGIGVDPRHLSLIADFMTQLGGYRACSRIGIESLTSPFLKITFETAANFLISATLHGNEDHLTSPASRIVLGKPVEMGSGMPELIQTVL